MCVKPRRLVIGVLVGLVGIVAGDARGVLAADIRCNCVLFARSKVPSLPYGLETPAAKRAIINSYTPRVGVVAIHSYNHVSVVTRVWTVRVPVRGGYRNDTYIKILEANYRHCQITTRAGSPGSLGVIGYFDPAKAR